MEVAKASGKLGILVPGMGAVGTTFIAGVYAINKGLSKPIGALSQMGRIRIGKRDNYNTPLISEVVDIHPLQDVVFGGWDVFDDNVYESAVHAKVLDKNLLDELKPELEAIKPMKAVFDKSYAKRLNGTHIKEGMNKMEQAEALMEDIRNFKEQNNCERLVMVWCGSTEIYIEEGDVHQTVASLEQGLRDNHKDIPPSMIYTYACLLYTSPSPRD